MHATPTQLTDHKLEAALKPVDSLIIFFHGYGSNGLDLLGIGQEWQHALSSTEFLSPDAPLAWEGGPVGFQWTSLLERDQILEGLEKVAPLVNAYIDDALAARGLTDKNLILVGFSQGGMLALHMATKRPHLAGVISYSGSYNVVEEFIFPRATPILLVHGTDDEILPLDRIHHARKHLVSQRAGVETFIIPELDHGIDDHGIDRGALFIQECFAR